MPKQNRKAWRRLQRPNSAALSPREKAAVLFLVLGLAVVGVLVFHFVSIGKAARGAEQRLGEMRALYGLTEAQVSAIREIELRFHGPGSPFLYHTRTREEQVVHLEEVASHLSPESARQFLGEGEYRDRPGLTHH